MTKTLPELMALAGAWVTAASGTGWDSEDDRSASPTCGAALTVRHNTR